MRDFSTLSAESLERVQYLLERMLELAELSAGAECTDERRAVLQKGLSFLRAEVLTILDETNGEGL